MANRIWRGDAVPIAQVVKITPSNPEVGDKFTIQINGKEVNFVATDSWSPPSSMGWLPPGIPRPSPRRA